MNKTIRKAMTDEEVFMGYGFEGMWKAVEYFDGPKKSGKYLVIDKDGYIKTMYCTGKYEEIDKARLLFRDAVDNRNEVLHGYYEEFKEEDFMALYRYPWGIWYEISDWTDDSCDPAFRICDTEESKPKYFLEINMLEKIKLDENGEIITDSKEVDVYELKQVNDDWVYEKVTNK